MRVKHLTFHDAPGPAWVACQERWLSASIGAGGLSAAFGAERDGGARAVFVWESEDALRTFMERDHDRALADAGSVGRHAALYLDLLEREGSPVGAGFLAESLAWVRDDGLDRWLADRRVWAEAARGADGYLGAVVAKGRHACLVDTFWRDRAAHERWLHDVVPGVRQRTDDTHTVRLVRFEAELTPSLVHADAAHSGTFGQA